jgi:hypothetical protein
MKGNGVSHGVGKSTEVSPLKSLDRAWEVELVPGSGVAVAWERREEDIQVRGDTKPY